MEAFLLDLAQQVQNSKVTEEEAVRRETKFLSEQEPSISPPLGKDAQITNNLHKDPVPEPTTPAIEHTEPIKMEAQLTNTSLETGPNHADQDGREAGRDRQFSPETEAQLRTIEPIPSTQQHRGGSPAPGEHARMNHPRPSPPHQRPTTETRAHDVEEDKDGLEGLEIESPVDPPRPPPLEPGMTSPPLKTDIQMAGNDLAT